jgi:protein-S-isoprenylcysteine O-methyltransferase Ste14
VVLLNILFDYLLVAFAMFFVLFFDYPRSILLPIIKQMRIVKHRDDRYSVWFLFISDNISLIISTGILVLGIGRLPGILLYIGIGMIISGLLLRQIAISALGIFFAPTVRIIKNHKIITNGPYRYIRHPSYTGALLFLFGMAIASRYLEAILITLVLTVPAYLYRIRIEERSLISHAGGSYIRYMGSTKMLIPYLI